MPRLSSVYCLLAVFFVSTCTYSQQSIPKTLLWRITGKGLKQPSYLYGTMHLTDNRLFNLGDSVYRAIEKSEGLAIEVNPDEMAAYYINKAIDEAEGTSLKQLLNEKDYKKYSDALAKKFKKPAAEITTGDVVAEKNKWLREYMAKGEMPTFLDAYLYNIARRQGKWVGGVEDMSDQAGLLDQLVDKSDIDYILAGDSSYINTSSNNMMERMVRLYSDQDLAGIEAMTEDQSHGFKDLLLIKRNVKMARRIDSLTALRTMFIAIGSAHLPGDSGVIQLLQKRGFTVEPVFSLKKTNAKDYTFKEVKFPWTETEDKDGLYKVSMPGNAASVKVFGLIEMKFMTDLFNLSNYCTMAVVGPRRGVNKDTLILEVAQRIFRTKEKLPAKKVYNNGIEGNEYLHTVMGEKLRLQAFVYENVLYVAFMSSVKQEALTSTDAGQFFSSFIITKKLPVSAGAKPFVDSVMGISFMTPAELTYNKKLSADHNGWHISAFTGTDMVNGMYIFLYSKDLTPGHFLNSDTLVQRELLRSLETRYTNLQIDTVQLAGYKGLQLQGTNTIQAGLYMNAVSLIKNNRNIVLMVISDSLHQQAPVTQNIFTSLRAVPAPVVHWSTHMSADSSFSALTPGPFRMNDQKESNLRFSFDSTTASSYYAGSETLSKYTWFKQDSLFWKEKVKQYIGKDSLVSETDIVYNGQPAKELLTNKDYSYRRRRILLHGDLVYEIFITGDKDFVNNADATAYLNSFTIHIPQKNNHFITQSKAAMLLQDLGSQDSLVSSEARQFLDNAKFDREDVPALHQALLKQYQSSYADTLSDFVNLQLAETLGLLKDPTTIAFVKEQYPTLINEKEYLKNTLLATLAHFHTQESYTCLAQLLNQYNPPTEGLAYNSISGFRDSLSLVAPIFSTIQKLAKDSASCAIVADLALLLKDSGYIKQEQIALAANDYIQTARKYIPAFKREEFYLSVYNLLKVIGSFNSIAGNDLLKSYLTVKDNYVKKQAVLQLLKNKQPVPTGEILKLAADADVRINFYDDLKELKKTTLFPKQFATQQAFGESIVYEIASDDYEVKKITFLAKKIAKHNGKSYTFYLYRVVLEDEEPAGYLGVAGGYTTGSTSLEAEEALSGIYWEETYKETKVNNLFKAFLESR
ncbi:MULTISPECIES: TraB/GumN family protein [Niastella]|uniref:TraB/GumN family protein n=1 Tax=Niastella soli TaxID=2821487 RepID=A0ABS3YXJ5_9BACT|nr:TraB/GumN family protein [Niastella soli]MBO9202636.1 TraB/GumN family protein [Niastella soli]